MMCKQDGSKNWICMKLNDDEKWEKVGHFDEVNIENTKVKLFLAAGHVLFDGESCEMDDEGSMKTMEC